MSDDSEIPGLEWFDCNARIGRWSAPRPEQFTDLKDLLEVYDSVGIRKALAYYSWAWEWSPARGNGRLLAEMDGNERLRPCFVALPHATGEHDPPEQFAATIGELGGAVRIFPRFHQWRISEWCARSLFEALEEHRVPVLLHIDEADWDAIAGMLAAHPDLPLIILGTYYRVDRYLYPLWEKHDNLYLEANTYGVFRGIEAVCERFGAERFVFGTGLPELEPGGPMAQLTYADISDEDKRLIASGNLERLLAGGGVGRGPVPRRPFSAGDRPPPYTSLQDYCLTGTPLEGELIIDAHAHMGPWHNFNVPHDGSAEAMVRSMDALGVDVIIVSPDIAIGPDYLAGNREVAEAAEQFPGRIIPFVTINPNYPRKEIEAEIGHWHETTGIRAFKLHPGCHKATTLDEEYTPVYEYCQEHALPILSHCWNGEGGMAKVIATLTERYPAISFINAHSANSWEGIEQNCKICAQHDNFYLDLTGSLLLWGAVETMVQRVGADKILFGTDMPFIDPRPGFGRMLCARISDDDKRKILGLNAKRIFSL